MFSKVHMLQGNQSPVAVHVPGRGLSRDEGHRLGYYQTVLRDGTLGYSARRMDDCLQAALATCVQAPSPTVPDPRLDERLIAGEDPEEIARSSWLAMVRWAARCGLTITIHPSPPTSERRWIGVVPAAGVFNDHCLVMNRSEILFDPMSLRRNHSQHDPSEIDWGITLTKE
jgi:hypothetical protein